MNIIIPCAGLGERFKQDGYTMPKPLICVLGEPLIFHVIKNLKIREGDNIHIVYHEDLDVFNFRYILLKEFPHLNFIRVNFNTRGPAETALCALNNIRDLNKDFLVIDCDTFYEDDIIKMIIDRSADILHAAIFYFKDNSKTNIFSFVNINYDVVFEIKEKERISDNACTGAYYFANGNTLKTYCELVLDMFKTSKGEFYFSNVYSLLLDNDFEVTGIKVDKFHCLGTPQQLKEYCLTHDNIKWHNKRFCFDLDNTLVTFPEEDKDYSTVMPVIKTINYLKYLKSLGNTIIISTARGMKTYDGNIELAKKANREQIIATLDKFEIPYDELHFGKPYAHFYIDDLSVRPFEDMNKHIGFYNAKVEPRHFNRIEYGRDLVIKTTSNDGEIFYYKNIPKSIKHLFPHMHSCNGNTIVIDRVSGIVFSYLLINNSFTIHNLEVLFKAIDDIHNSADPIHVNTIKDSFNLFANYNDKLDKRYANYNYSEIATDQQQVYFKIAQGLQLYKTSGLSQIGVIHGDPVFSNIFLCDRSTLKFIDMRGKVGTDLTIYGDIFYDYAKIYQSLMGYDSIVAGYEINETYLNTLRANFIYMFRAKFSEPHWHYLKFITASLFFSLIPLHTDREKQIKYYNLAKQCIL